MPRLKLSVAMAAYNGEKYIKEQLGSILSQLGEKDEVIISDDGSTDGTLKVVRSFKDKRIHIVEGPKKGPKQNFANAIAHTTGDIIFLADQDDIWLPEKVKTIIAAFKSHPDVTTIVHDAEIFSSDTGEVTCRSNFKRLGAGPGYHKNILKNTYTGCCMAFRSQMKSHVLPIPDNIEMHDQWIGVLSDRYGKTLFLDKVLLRYRRHTDNVSNLTHYPLSKMLRNRTVLLRELNKRKQCVSHER